MFIRKRLLIAGLILIGLLIMAQLIMEDIARGWSF